MDRLTLALARDIAEAVIVRARENHFALAVAIVDPGGWPRLQLVMDGAFPAAGDAALAKARTAALYRRPTSTFSERVKQGMPLAYLPHVVPLGGGIPLLRQGSIYAALGVSGAFEDSETALAEDVAAAFSDVR